MSKKRVGRNPLKKNQNSQMSMSFSSKNETQAVVNDASKKKNYQASSAFYVQEAINDEPEVSRIEPSNLIEYIQALKIELDLKKTIKKIFNKSKD